MAIQLGQSLAVQSYSLQPGGSVGTRGPSPTKQSVPQGALTDAGTVGQPNPATSPTRDRSQVKTANSAQFVGPDVVKVQLDNQDADYPVVVYRFVNNKSGELVVQVPTQQAINQQRTIAAEFRVTAQKTVPHPALAKG